MDFLHQLGQTKSFRDLPQRRQESLVCLGANLTNKEIARRLGISFNTVHVHLDRLFRKSGAHRPEQLVRKLLGGGRKVTHL
jgi:DNA-binding NarL/FixJ family response regulator